MYAKDLNLSVSIFHVVYIGSCGDSRSDGTTNRDYRQGRHPCFAQCTMQVGTYLRTLSFGLILILHQTPSIYHIVRPLPILPHFWPSRPLCTYLSTF